jgi:hypothetical protein
MKKNTWLMTMVGLFLAATLVWAVPGFAQNQGWTCPKGNTPGAGQMRGGGSGNCPNYNAQTCPQYGQGKQARSRGQGRWNNPQAPVNPNPQAQPQTQVPQSSN